MALQTLLQTVSMLCCFAEDDHIPKASSYCCLGPAACMSWLTRLGVSKIPSFLTSALGITGLVAGGLGKAAMDHIPAHHLSHKPPLWGARFDNPWPTWTGDKSFTDVWKFVREVRRANVPQYGYLSTNRNPTLEECSQAFPLVAPDAAALANPPAAAVQAMWVGHATMLVQMEGLSFITDPLFSQRASPVQFMGPQRCVQPAVEPEHPAFPKLDFVLISHNHYDHLDTGSVARLKQKFGPELAWYVPLGLKSWFKGQGITNVRELDWWQEIQHPGSKVRLVLTPAQHWSARGGFDRRATLWGGWAVLGQHLRFWFAGDTAYCPVFKEIGERLGPFDLSAIPIGAYEPRDFMRAQHIGPDEAVTVHKEVRSKRSVGIHCCTFCLTLEPLDEPPTLLQQILQEQRWDPREFVTLRHGAILQTADGKDLNSPPVLPYTGELPN